MDDDDGMMHDVMTLLPGGWWIPVPCTEWSYHYVYPQDGGETWRTFTPGYVHDLPGDGWSRLAEIISTCCPQAQGAVGALLIRKGKMLAGENIPGIIIVALGNNRHPFETAYHESMHEIWNHYLDDDEQGTLSDHANGLPGRRLPDKWEEAVCEAFGLWAVGKPLGDPPDKVLALFVSIKHGEVGKRKRKE